MIAWRIPHPGQASADNVFCERPRRIAREFDDGAAHDRRFGFVDRREPFVPAPFALDPGVERRSQRILGSFETSALNCATYEAVLFGSEWDVHRQTVARLGPPRYRPVLLPRLDREPLGGIGRPGRRAKAPSRRNATQSDSKGLILIMSVISTRCINYTLDGLESGNLPLPETMPVCDVSSLCRDWHRLAAVPGPSA